VAGLLSLKMDFSTMNGQSDLTEFFDFNNASFPENDISMQPFDYNALGDWDNNAMTFSAPGLDEK
jgi:hypothetical protein